MWRDKTQFQTLTRAGGQEGCKRSRPRAREYENYPPQPAITRHSTLQTQHSHDPPFLHQTRACLDVLPQRQRRECHADTQQMDKPQR